MNDVLALSDVNDVLALITYYLASSWLSNFAFRDEIGFLVFLLSGAISFSFALLCVGYQAMKVANSNPVDALRYE